MEDTVRYRVRALTLACTATLVAAGGLMAFAATSGAQAVSAADCGSTTYRFLFWPEGHDEIKSQGFPAMTIPHLEVYAGKGKKFLDSQNVAYADGTSATTAATCTPADIPGGGQATLKSTSQTKQLVCKFAKNPVFVAVPASTVDAPSLSVVVDGDLMVNATLGTPGSGSSLDYNAKVCKLKKSPK
jgi:hypothetical protein